MQLYRAGAGEARLLGPVGERIVAETMVGLMVQDSSSFLSQDPRWTPDPDLMRNGKFGLSELILAALAEVPELAEVI